MQDDVSEKRQSVSGQSSSGESVVLHTPFDEPVVYTTPLDEQDLGQPPDAPPLLDHCSRLGAPDLAEVGYNLDYLAATRGPQGLQDREMGRRIVTASEWPTKPIGDRNCVIRFKRSTRKFWAEFFGTAVLALFGTAVNHQVALGGSTLISSSPVGSYVSVAFGWGLAVMLGVVLSGGLSGGHLNPAVTLALAIFRGFSWGMVPLYWLAQFTGATFGAALELLKSNQYCGRWFWNSDNQWYWWLILYNLPYVSNFNCFYNELLMTAILMLFILTVGDPGNIAPVQGLGPFIILWVVVGLASALGMQTSFALNPARDIGPRILTWFAGYGNSVWTIRNCYWFTVATLGPVFGAIIGCAIYDLFLATEQVPDVLLHGHSRVFSSWRQPRPSTTAVEPDRYLTRFSKKRRAGAGVSRGAELNTGKTSSHRYVSLNAA